MSVSAEHLESVPVLSDWRHIHNESATLRSGVAMVTETDDWRLELMAQLTVIPDRFARRQFALFRSSPKSRFELPPELIITDRAAAEVLLRTESFDAMKESKIGTFAVRNALCGSVSISTTSLSVEPRLEALRNAKAPLVQATIDMGGRIKILDISANGTLLCAKWDETFADTEPNISMQCTDGATGAKILPFPSKSTS